MIATATMTSKGQVTVPVKVRQQFGFAQGTELVFIEEGGRLYVESATRSAFRRLQEAMAGEAERLGLKTEQDVVDMIAQIRRQRWEADHAGDA